MWFFRSAKDLLPEPMASQDAAEVAAAANLSPSAKGLLVSQMTAGDYLTVLMRHKLNVDSVPFLAHLMPKEKAVQWAVASCEMAMTKGPACPECTQALAAAKGWLSHPSSQTQQAAAQSAAAAPQNDPAAWAAQAAAWAGQTEGDGTVDQASAALTEAGVDAQPLVSAMEQAMPANLVAQATSGAVMLAAAQASAGVTLPDLPKQPTQPETPDTALPPVSLPEAKKPAADVELGMTAPLDSSIPEVDEPDLLGSFPPQQSPDVALPAAEAVPGQEKTDISQLPDEPVMSKKQMTKAHGKLKPFVEKGIEVANGPDMTVADECASVSIAAAPA